MCSRRTFLQLFFFTFLLIQGSSSIQIEGNVTENVIVIENGTVGEVILDCPYLLDEDDKPGLVIKWFYNGDDHPIFQWIPEGQMKKPQVLSMEANIDEDHVVDEDPHHRHRALKLLSPYTEVHGLYTCEVSSHFDEKSLDVNLIVYTLPSAMTLTVDDSDPENITVTCISEPSFPEPDLDITLVVGDTSSTLEGERETTWSSGLYNTTLWATVEPARVSAAPIVEFQCTLTIPHTDLSVTEGFKYRSDGLPIDEEIIEETVIELSEEDNTFVEVMTGASTHKDAKISGTSSLHEVAFAVLTAALFAALRL